MLYSLNQTVLGQGPNPQNATALVAGIAVLALGLFLTVPAVTAIASHCRQPKPKPRLYEDKDGVACEESMAAYSAKAPKIILSVFAVAGFAAATFLAVMTTLHRNDYSAFVQNWLNVAQWAIILVQLVSINIVREPTKFYSLGLYSALSCAFLFTLVLFQVGILVQSQSPDDNSWTHSAQIAGKCSQLVASSIAALASVSLPRRPDVFYDGAPVDRMSTQSALYKASFTWVQSVLLRARKTGHLDLKDLPKMSHRVRARDLSNSWAEKEHPRRLWVEVILAYKWPLVTQWTLTIVQAFGNFAPQFVTFQILRILENRFSGEQVPAEAWIWVIVLTITTISSSWIEAWLFWVSWSELAIPVRAQLSALIFQKSMRRKDVKAASKVLKVEHEDSAAATGNKSEDEEEDDNPKGKQSTVNLIGVDTKRVSDFCSFNNFFPGSLFKLLVSLAFLWSILGWQSLLAGFMAMAVTIPVNIYFSKRYSDAQDRVMKARDLKMAVVTEALQGIRQIKFSALEGNWSHKIGQFRAKELDEQWSVFVADTALLFCWISSPILLSAASLAVYALLNGTLTPSVAFTAIGVFGNLEVTLSVIPELTTDLIDAYISVGRIEKYLKSPEISPITSDASSISFENASIAWPSDENSDTAGDRRYILRNLNLSFPKNELSVVSGKTGTGKSLLLAAILGEVDVLSGKIHVPHSPSTEERHDHLATKDNWIIPNSIAFVAQIPWIENASIKDNILFGLPFDAQRYNKVIESCALRKDLDMLSDGENTEIGANGINLSGGQRWRVTFARALYSRAGTLILDDIFSAVDAHVGRFIFEKGLTGELGIGRTRILVTHHVALVKSRTKYVVELGDGTVENAGLVDDLEAGTLDNIASHQETENEIREDEEATAVNSEESSDAETMDQLKKVNSKQAPKKFVEEEAREHGRVKIKIFWAYMKAAGGVKFWALALLAFAALQCVTVGRSWWLKVWSGNGVEESMAHAVSYSFHTKTPTAFYTTPSTNMSAFSDNPGTDYNLGFYLTIYVALSVVGAILGTFKYYYIFTGAIRASRVLFNDLCFTVLRTPLRWVDTVPLGRILNRFTTDFEVIDARLSGDISGGLHDFLQLCGIIAAGIFVSPYVIILSVLLLSICIWIASIYLDGAREVKRLESTVKSPIFEQFGSALTGVGTIRAFSKTDTYINRMYGKLDDYSTAFWHLWAFNRWMGLRMALVGGLFSTIVASIILLAPYVEASLAGFALSFALNYGLDVIWIIRHYANLELEMNAVERVTEYSNVKIESQDGADPPAAWPSEGRLEVNDLVVAYAPDLPPVLKGLTFRVERSERIGVVGRTGAGKSSLTLALFRFLEASQGSIHIDGLDISKIKLHALRSRLAIIPQDPVLFSGTVRTNLDAFDEHTDSELRDALERVHLVNASEFAPSPAEPSTSASASASGVGNDGNQNINPFASLSSPVSEGGLNLSQGQRQLLCLARAIVSRPKIVVLDEATSAVDMATDALIQRSIREEFGDSTLIVIAHRLSTIIDFDKILVMDDGRVAEFGTPKELLQIEGGILRGMVRESGEREKLEKLVLG